MQSTAKDVTTYLQEVPADRQQALHKIRELCLSTLEGYQEIMAYGGPCYARNGEIEVGFASQKHFIGLYILNKEVLDAHRHKLKGLSVGKGCIRYSKPAKIDFALIEQLLRDTSNSHAEICPPAE
jgi:uncharacterized protein YdhG (YjbR/CyaY superfamily)